VDRPLATRRLFIAALFLAVFAVHVASPVMTSWDSRWSIPTAVSIVREGNTDLDEYRATIAAQDYYGIDRTGGHLRTFFPVGVSLLAVPFVAVADRLNAHPAGAPAADTFSIRHAAKLERFIASLVVAAAAVVVFLTASVELPPLPALGLAALFAFGTSAWSVASRALWQHGPSMLLLAIALYLFVRGRARPGMVAYAGIPLALAYVIRPTNAVAVVVFTVLVAWKTPRALPRYVLFAAPIAAAFVWYSAATYGSVVPPYYQPARVERSPHFWIALAGNLVSPARGLFVYTPVFLLCFAGVALKLRRRTFDSLDAALVALCVLHWIVISSFPHWWGGHSYGPRFFADLLPVFVYFLIPVVQAIRQASGTLRRAAAAGFVALSTIGIAVHARGAIDKAVWRWNAAPVDVDRAPGRLWDFRDPPFLR
jgi:hypothetical protein